VEPGGGGYQLGLGLVEFQAVARWMPPSLFTWDKRPSRTQGFTAHGPRGWRLAAGAWRMGLENRIWVHMSYAQRVTDMDSLYPYPQNYYPGSSTMGDNMSS
jgi:hypothetical protein